MDLCLPRCDPRRRCNVLPCILQYAMPMRDVHRLFGNLLLRTLRQKVAGSHDRNQVRKSPGYRGQTDKSGLLPYTRCLCSLSRRGSCSKHQDNQTCHYVPRQAHGSDGSHALGLWNGTRESCPLGGSPASSNDIHASCPLDGNKNSCPSVGCLAAALWRCWQLDKEPYNMGHRIRVCQNRGRSLHRV